MPLIKSKSKKALKGNFHELRHGRTFKKTAAKFGKKRAVKQMQAIALKTQRDAKSSPRKRG
jgi:hypothetical protein